ncbi:hypothetical protein AB1N83_008041 [Pleurotus pulmonarius]
MSVRGIERIGIRLGRALVASRERYGAPLTCIELFVNIAPRWIDYTRTNGHGPLLTRFVFPCSNRCSPRFDGDIGKQL